MAAKLEVLIAIQEKLDGLQKTVSGIQDLNRKVVDTAQRFQHATERANSFGNALLSGLGIDLARRATAALQSVFVTLERGLVAGVRFNAMLEQQAVAFGTLLGSRERAEARMRDLVKLAASTPFELGEVVQASRLLQSLAGDTFAAGDSLRLVGDAAAAVGRPFAEVAFWIGRMAAALRGGLPLGEAISRLTEMGLVTADVRTRLDSLSGQVLSTGQVVTILRDSFGANAGAMARQAETFNGLVSTLKDSLNQLAGEASKPLFESFKNALKDVLILLGSLPTETEKIVADLEAKVARMREAATTAPAAQQQQVREAVDAVLREQENRAAQLRALISGKSIFGPKGELVESALSGKDFTGELAAIENAVRSLRVTLGLLGRAEGMQALVSETARVREQIAQLEARAREVRTTIRFTQSGAEFPLPVQTLKAEADARRRGLQEGTAEFATFVDRELEKARAKTAQFFEQRGSNAVTIFRQSALDAAGQTELDKLRAELATLEQSAQQRAAQAEANSARERAVALVERLKSSETQITEEYRKHAESDTERERRLRAELQSLNQKFETERASLDLIEDRGERERAIANLEREHKTEVTKLTVALKLIEAERDKSRLEAEEKLKKAARERLEAEASAARASLEAELQRLRGDSARLDGDFGRTEAEKWNERRRVLQDTVAAQQLYLDQQRAIRDAATTPEARAIGDTNVQMAQRDLASAQAQLATVGPNPNSVLDQLRVGIKEISEQWGKHAQLVANLFLGPIKAGIQAARDGMQQLLGTTEHWTNKLGTVAGSIMGAITSAISDMFAAWIAGLVRKAATEKALTVAQGAVEYAAKLPGALLSSISSFGAAAIIGVAALTAALASFASGGLVSGAGGPEDDRILARLSNGEFIVRAAAVQKIGPTFLEGINRGVLDLSALPAQMAADLARSAPASGAGAAPAGATSSADNRPIVTNFALVNFRSEMRRFMQQEGVRMAFDFATKQTRRV